MDWAIQGGVLSWVTSTPGGRILIREGATLTNANRFHFPYVAHQPLRAATGYRLSFAGEVCLHAPSAQWTLRVRNPTVDIDARADIALVHTELTRGRMELARISLPPAAAAPRQTRVWRDATTVLAEAAVAAFAGVCAPNSSLAPITLTVPCDEGAYDSQAGCGQSVGDGDVRGDVGSRLFRGVAKRGKGDTSDSEG
ncbi:HtaA domain-containing protein [Microbacterium trichothecenolyticum]|uniref:HtaA domain-containing protein n=1 Tax=Microbacterium ureisolvens TaxID=2781186 RepID=A0ABS7I105_9MICO|nr:MULTISPECIES: HtaA domain-containing protein [Microbacterium]MBW9110445.1 HtaA domain-containing protein [Microbacterium ureisolvens]MBW9120550.1 HtaA domain-containing protein [Microbacterium trichothecenolyticum]